MGFLATYTEYLEDLKTCDRNTILLLAELAKDNVAAASQIVTVVEKHLLATNNKVPALYVLDAIVKTSGEPFPSLFSKNLGELFASLWPSADADLKTALTKVAKTWDGVIPSDVLLPIRKLLAQPSPSVLQPAQPPSTQVAGRAADPRRQLTVQDTAALRPMLPVVPAGHPALPRPVYSSTIPTLAATRPLLSAGPDQLKSQVPPPAQPYVSNIQQPRQALPTFGGVAGFTTSAQPTAPSVNLGRTAQLPSAMHPAVLANVAPALQGQLGQHGLAGLGLQPGIGAQSLYVGQARATGGAAMYNGQTGLIPSPTAYFPQHMYGSYAQPPPVISQAAPVVRPTAAPVPGNGSVGASSHSPARRPSSTGVQGTKTTSTAQIPASSTSDFLSALHNINDLVQKQASSSPSRADAPFDIRSSVLDASKLKESHQGVIDELLSMTSKTRAKHMDWSFVRRRRQKTNPIQCRQWFVTTENWLSGTTVLPESAAPFFDTEMSTAEQTPVQEFSEPVDDSQRECAISGERFEEFYDPDTDGWRYKDARRLFGDEAALYNVPDGSIVKVVCLRSTPAADVAGSAASDVSDRSSLVDVPADVSAEFADLEGDDTAAAASRKRSATDLAPTGVEQADFDSSLLDLPAAKRSRISQDC